MRIHWAVKHDEYIVASTAKKTDWKKLQHISGKNEAACRQAPKVL